ncbi:hypothetical protein PACTADRAFT_58115 [Pachysolen tannophilus NRRL Y-2460]|uniref:V-type proton ATPase subunit H n=1 Tax=Pachysolen tannophilus NRRL Y-2460 TaxID=669874 RepID=A0A1E4TUI7_PACTA|nr:hypothetical protein PACTADRAFT_58115 [Pachysolen tannophilus NRRL Y-2460]
MTIESYSKFVIDSPFFESLTKPISSRPVPWEGYARSNQLSIDEADSMKKLDIQEIQEKIDTIDSNVALYSTKVLAVLNKLDRNDAIENLLDLIAKTYTDNNTRGPLVLLNGLLELNNIDSSLPFNTIAKFLDNQNETIQMLSSYDLTILLISAPKSMRISNDIVSNLFQLITTQFLVSENKNLVFFGIQLLKELLSISSFRHIFWSFQSNFFPPLYKLLNQNSTDLQLRYYTLLSIWLLSFNKEISIKLPELYKDIIAKYLSLSKDSVKEKIVRLAVSTLANFISIPKNENIIKVFLYEKAVDIFNQLIERKWADDELKQDLSLILTTLNDAVVNLTTFDQYEIELSKEQFNWSPPHKSEEFWIENVTKFKENNFKIFVQLIKLLQLSEDEQDAIFIFESLSKEQQQQFTLNQAIICHDLGMVVKHLPESIKFLEKNPSLKYTIMNLMNSQNADVKYEALRTTQILVSHSFTV